MHSSEEQGFGHKADRQTFRGGAGWGDYGVGDSGARMEFADRMGRLREELSIGLGIGKPMLSDREREEPGAVARMTLGRRCDIKSYNPGARLGKRLDEHHEETKVTNGWIHSS